jgi:hypothetical protein
MYIFCSIDSGIARADQGKKARELGWEKRQG